MRRSAVFALMTGLGLLVAAPAASRADDPPATPAAPKVQPLPPVATPPPVVVQPSPYHPPTVVPGTVVPGPVVVPGPAVVPGPVVVPGPAVVPGTFIPPAYPSGLISRYNPLAGPPYAMPVFPDAAAGPTTAGPRPSVSVTYVAGRTSQIAITAPAGQTFPADVRVQSVADTSNAITWEVKSASVSADRRTLNVTIEGKGLSKKDGQAPESGNLTIALAGTGTLPTVQPVPVVYVTPR